MYSASKFHFVGIDRTLLAQVRIASRLLKPSTEAPPVAPVPHVHIGTSPSDRGMVETVPAEPAWLLRHLTVPVAAAVALAVGAAWYATWTSADILTALTAPSLLRSTDLVLFFAPYFLVWGAFGVAALLALSALGLMGPMTGPLVFASAVTLVGAGLWQVTRTKEVCLTHCTSPMSFVLHHWRSGRSGAVRMGFRHSLYCIGCCWLFMLVLFVSGSMSLLWMGGLSVVIFAEKLGVRQDRFARAFGVVLVALGGLAVFGAVLPR